MKSQTIIRVFDDLFATDFSTTLHGGAAEPLYCCGPDGGGRIYFREDFSSSALHEVAHWCIAGARRRCQRDYGYWYKNTRSPREQGQFQCMEKRPQALEWIFSIAAGVPFRVSIDNFNEASVDAESFSYNIRSAAQGFLRHGLPARAQVFAIALAEAAGCRDFMNHACYRQLPVI